MLNELKIVFSGEHYYNGSTFSSLAAEKKDRAYSFFIKIVIIWFIKFFAFSAVISKHTKTLFEISKKGNCNQKLPAQM